VQVVPAGGVVEHGLQGNHADPEHIHLFVVDGVEGADLLTEQGEALGGQGQVLVHVPGVVGDEVVVEEVLVG